MKGQMRILDQSGHQTLEWDTEVKDGPLDPAYVEAEFNELVRQGWFAYGTTEANESVQLKRFDSTYPKVTLSPLYVGG